MLRQSLLRIVNQGDDHTSRQITLLLCLHDGFQTVKDLAAQMNIGKPAVTRAVDRLSVDGYVERQPDPHDQRGVRVKLTTSGSKFLREMTT
jgi:DNA-binding MarR family transcriptional regulator